MKTAFIVDGNSILNRAFYGVRGLATKDGMPTNAIFGMVNILQKHLESLKPDYAAVAFDLRAPTFRHKMFDGYKATRKGMPEELAVQLPYAKECVEGLGCHVVECEGYEADDILGTLATSFSKEDVQVYLLTGDRDSLQLIDERVTILLATNKETISFDEGRFQEEYGVPSSAFVDVKALMGDSSDNIPGVPGIGTKTALKLISDFGSLDGVYAGFEASALTASVKNKLNEGKDSAYLSQKLATICRTAPVDVRLDSYSYLGVQVAQLRRLFEFLAFSGLIRRMGLDREAVASEDEGDVLDGTSTFVAEAVTIDKLSKQLAGKTLSVSSDDESFFFYDGETVYSLRHKTIIPSEFIELLRGCKIVVHDSKAFYKTLDDMGIFYRSCYFDTMLAAYVLNASRSSYALEETYLEYMGKSLGEGFPRAVAIFSLFRELEKKLLETGVESLMMEIEMPLAAVLYDMEKSGFRVDVDGIARYGEQLNEEASDLALRIYSLAGGEFNIQSPKQLGEVLFERLGLPAGKKTKTGYSTNAEVLSKLMGKHPIVEDILEYRQLTKLKSTYADGLLKVADEKGRIHTVFHQTGTATGRLSSAEPNLQNIPIRTALGREFRKFFIPENEDYVLVDADYSQIELRLLAAISGDESMISAFASGEDIHASTAQKVFGVNADQVTPELRKRAKAVNFGIVYGIGEFSLSEDLNISMAQAKKYIDSYLAGYPAVSAYLNEIKQKGRADGYVSTLFGRRRYIPELSSSNKNLQHFGERVAMNSPIQGSAADIIKIAMIRVARRLSEGGIDAKMILQVHDELLLEAHKDCAEEALRILVEEMENAIKLPVPLEVDAHIGKTWFDAK